MRKALLVLTLLLSSAACSSAGDPLTFADASDSLPTGDAVAEDGVVGDIVGGDLTPDGAGEVLEEVAGDLGKGDIPPIPAGCCFHDLDCEDGESCVNTTNEAFGACLPTPMATSMCWKDSDCDGQGPCISKLDYMPLVVDCENKPVEQGLCKGMYTYCCFADSDCPETDAGETMICVGLGEDPYGGTCMVEPKAWQCYGDLDCEEGFQCMGAAWCPCGYDCDMAYWGPGECVPKGGTCCMHDSDCLDGHMCAAADQATGHPGVCKAIPVTGGCWDSSMCGENEYCSDAAICPCNADCDMEDQLGTCKSLADECCFSDIMCADGKICFGAGPGGYPGMCVTPQTDGKCWSDADCGPEMYCDGVAFNGCGAPSPMYPGVCMPTGIGCCTDDFGCDDGLTCAVKVPGFGGVCLPEPELGRCWDDEDCPGGMCENEWFCGCGEVCMMMRIDTPGACVWPVEACGTELQDTGSGGIGKACPNGDSDCEGLPASMCSSGVMMDPSLTPVCTRWCSGADSCPAGSFCIDKGWSSICVPNACAEGYLASCGSSSECILARHFDQCCACPIPVTTAQLGVDKCLIPLVQSAVPEECFVDCTAVLCAECPEATSAFCANHTCQANYL